MAAAITFGIGRALPVLWIAPSLRRASGARRIDAMATEPRVWLGLRRLDALGLSLCVLFLSVESATAAVLPNATDPSAANNRLAWQRVGDSGALRLPSGETRSLPGSHPALGGSVIAWETAGRITVADATTMATVSIFVAAGVNALAVSDSWLVYRDKLAGRENLVGVSLRDPDRTRYIAGSKLAGEVGRPTLDGSKVVFTYDTRHRNIIEIVDLVSGARRVLRSSTSRAALMNPSMLDGRLLFERVDRCRQQLRIGSLNGPRGDRVLLSVPSTARRDPGYQPGYEHAYNRASLCPNRASGPGATVQLGPTALSASAAYVTEISSNSDRARIFTVLR